MGILDDVKKISEMIKKYNDQDLYERIINLRDEIFELREQLSDAKEEIKELKQAEDIGSKLVRDPGKNYYRMEDDPDGEKPFCLACWDYEKKLVNMTIRNTHHGAVVKCKICASRMK